MLEFTIPIRCIDFHLPLKKKQPGYPACGNPPDADSENVPENPKCFDRHLSSATPGYTFMHLFTLPGLVLPDRPHAGRAYVQLVCQDHVTRKAK